MNTAKNKKSTFINLFEVLDKFESEERDNLFKFLTVKRQDPKQLDLCKKMCSLLDDGETSETIDEFGFKKRLLNTDSTDNSIQKLITNLYERVLVFLSDEYKKDNWKDWQIEANETLLKIEALFEKELYSQAVALLLKLERSIKNKEKGKKWVYDDISIYTRLANLKISLSFRTKNLFSVEEKDKILKSIIGIGDFFYRSNNEILQDVYKIDNYKMEGYQVIVEHYVKKKEYKKALDSINQLITQSNIVNKEYSKENESYKQFLIQYKQLLALKINDRNELSKIKSGFFNTVNPLSTALLFEQVNFELQISLSLINNNFQEAEEFIPYGLYLFSKDKIELFELRKEMNSAILLFVNNDISGCYSLIKQIKSNRKVKSKDNPLYLKVLFLELMLGRFENSINTDNLIRSIKGILKNKKRSEFEYMAVNLLKEWVVENVNNVSEIEKLDTLINEAEPMHHLIIAALENRL